MNCSVRGAGYKGSATRDQRAAQFESEQKRLLRLAYRMLGSVTEAEDAVQDAWLRWHGKEDEVDNAAAYLTRVVTRVCLDRLKSAQRRREIYVGPWLPEPLVCEVEVDHWIEDDITYSLMLAMERLSPLERAAFLLHDVFDIPLSEIALTLEREPAAVRKLASRARRNIKEERKRYSIDAEGADRMARAFFIAARDGDTAQLSAMLAEDVEIHTDGGGRIFALRNIVRGIERVIRLLQHANRKHVAYPTLLHTMIVDGLPGYLSLDDGIPQATILDSRDGKIVGIYIVKNPDKLTHMQLPAGLD
ncbi:sigma-70 family RNA polymerase sigma factor [Qipengyuania sp. GH25]|uniref:Sigma-70 family RNA polymerase sigma factor n=1 Tax=Qipengyuania pacifica TaxID=2860199 RepID=A0ABS7JK54_9SPHN|nr:sigma-70 family RNA polymerase sigma factor [Qipengyuania aerophila]MBX7489776.1 sigma-70 family RNA polymerase sigma factor [Qipengyuania aerophila]